MQGVMLNATTDNGTVLAYPNFLDTVNAIRPMMLMRVIGGALYLAGWFLLAYNLYRTIRELQPVNGTIEVFDDEPAPVLISHGLLAGLLGTPVVFCASWPWFRLRVAFRPQPRILFGDHRPAHLQCARARAFPGTPL